MGATRRALGWAHPRVSGENDAAALRESVVLGSSPRERGKRSVIWGTTNDPGLIPA